MGRRMGGEVFYELGDLGSGRDSTAGVRVQQRAGVERGADGAGDRAGAGSGGGRVSGVVGSVLVACGAKKTAEQGVWRKGIRERARGRYGCCIQTACGWRRNGGSSF